MSDKPRLRPLDFHPVNHEGQQVWLLRDPLELVDYKLLISPELAQLLAFFDGTRDVRGVQSAFLLEFGVKVEMEQIKTLLERLDEACLLDNDRYRRAMEAGLEIFRDQPFRPPALSGYGYPGDAETLEATLNAFGEGDDLDGWSPWYGRGIISPHIDYGRGGRVYAQVWRRAQNALQEADLVLMFGTDHNGSSGKVTLTRLPYATPYGIIPTDPGLIKSLAKALQQDVFDEELHHKNEHSVELSAVWLHHFCQGASPPMVPILCGSFHGYLMNGRHPSDDPDLTSLVETLRAQTAGKRVLAVASVDLAHVGPSFGDEFTMDAKRREELSAEDASLMEAIIQGDAARFYNEIAEVEDRNRICGFSSIYLMLRFLGRTEGMQIAYEQCPADAQNHSLVSICGLLLQ